MARFYANENFPRKVVLGLRALGHDVLTVAEAENANRRINDEEVLAFAASDDRIVLTLNRRDFIALHSTASRHAGIVVCTQDADIARQIRQIDETVRSLPALRGVLVRINKPQR